MTLSKHQRYFRKRIDALKLAAPFAIASRYDSYSRCVEASICGAVVLKSRQIEAQAIPCAISGVTTDGSRSISVGLNARDIYDRFEQSDDLPSFETWRSEQPNLPDDPCPTHMVIEAKYYGERALIDLTVGQLRQDHGIDIGASISCFVEGWMEFDRPGWILRYLDSPHAQEIREKTKIYKNEGFVEDLQALMDIAMASNLDYDTFSSRLARVPGGEFARASAKLRNWMGL